MPSSIDMNCTAISALNDNYIWLLQEEPNSPYAYIVDPGDAAPVLTYLQQHQLELKGILITHHHRDHTGGVGEILNDFNVPVYGSQTIDCVTQAIHDNQTLKLENLSESFVVLAIPGHTLDHIAYYGANSLFCGDTLFAAGCGRVFEGTYEQMLTSLKRLMVLANSTQIYCGHEYTLKNLAFAATVEPNNDTVKAQIKRINSLLTSQQCSLPSTLATEKLTNPFLRCTERAIISATSLHAQSPLSSELEVFTELRQWKNDF